MQDLLIWIAISLGMLLGIFAIIIIAGCFMPRSHTIGRRIVLQQSPEAVWETITNYAEFPNWHPSMIKTEQLEDREGNPVWKETYKGNYPIILETTEIVECKKQVRTIADEDGPFSGRWVYELSAKENGCELSITEYGEIPNPFFRFMARVFMNPAIYLEDYLTALSKKFGEDAEL